MPTTLIEHLAAVVDRLTMLAKSDERLRNDLRALAHLVIETTEPPSLVEPSRSVPASDAVVGSSNETPAPAAPATAWATRALPVHSEGEPLPALTLGQTSRQETISIPPVISWTTPSDGEFPVMEARCKLKAEGCRWAAKRRQLLAEGRDYATEIEPVDRDIIARAKALPECFLWMCHKEGPQPADAGLFEIAAACFENLAEALSAVKQVLDEPGLHEKEFESSLDLLAEAQSAVRSIVMELDGRPDYEQVRAFNWLKDTVAANRVFIQRFMRIDDPADPRAWPGLAARIDELDGRVQEAQAKSKERRKLIGKVRHKASVIEANPHQAELEWKILIDTVEALIAGGLPPSNRDLRDALLPVIGQLPEREIPKGFQLVLREIDRYLSLSPAPATSLVLDAHAPAVQEVAKLLQGRSIVLIGGDRRQPALEAIVKAFGLKELIWIETRDHQSIAGFEPSIARSDVAVALLAIRWSSHSFGDAKQFCDRHGKPLVRLPTGYNPGQIASQILSQCSERLRQPT